MEAMPILETLLEEVEENEIELMVVKETLALLVSRLIAAGVVETDFLDDMIVCSDGLDCGRETTIISTAPPELRSDLEVVQQAARRSRGTLFGLVEALTRAFRR